MPQHFSIALTCAVALAAFLAGCETMPSGESTPAAVDVDFDGLLTVPSRAFDIAQVRPGTDFRAYEKVRLGEYELAYRTPDRAARQFPLTEEQKVLFRAALVAAFDDELAKLRVLEPVEEPGPSTLTLDVRVQDIVASVAPRAVGRSGRAAALLEASADAVIVVELRDSQSNEILARGVAAGSTSGAAIRTTDQAVQARFDSAEKLVAQWAATARAGLENLLDERR